MSKIKFPVSSGGEIWVDKDRYSLDEIDIIMYNNEESEVVFEIDLKSEGLGDDSFAFIAIPNKDIDLFCGILQLLKEQALKDR